MWTSLKNSRCIIPATLLHSILAAATKVHNATFFTTDECLMNVNKVYLSHNTKLITILTSLCARHLSLTFSKLHWNNIRCLLISSEFSKPVDRCYKQVKRGTAGCINKNDSKFFVHNFIKHQRILMNSSLLDLQINDICDGMSTTHLT